MSASPDEPQADGESAKPRPNLQDASDRPRSSLAGRMVILISTFAILYVLSIAPAANYCTPRINYSEGGRHFTVMVQPTAAATAILPDTMYQPLLWACGENNWVFNTLNQWMNLWGHNLVKAEVILNSVSAANGGTATFSALHQIITATPGTNSPPLP